MRIRGWQIEGFGTFHDYQVADVPDGLLVVHGPNEAGKSTLLAFLRGVLFGFARKGSDSTYPPLRGGRHGGAVFLEATDGVYRVERTTAGRTPPLIVRPDGSEGDQVDLRRLLGNADEILFRSVFAFSLQELTEMASLSSEGVRAHIFSAGIAGAGRSARKVLDDLDREAIVLLKPRAGRIREQISNANEIRARIRQATSAAADYPDISRREQARLVDVDTLRIARAACEAQANRLGKLIDLWPTEADLQRMRDELRALPEVVEFSENSDERLAHALARIERAQGGIDTATESLSKLEGQRVLIHVDDRLEAVREDVEVLASELAAQRELLRGIAVARETVETADAGVTTAFAELGPTWNESRLGVLDVTLPAAEEVRTRRSGLQAASEDAARATQELIRLDADVDGVDAALQQFAPSVDEAAEVASAERIDAFKGQVAAIANQFADFAALDVCSLAPGLQVDELVSRLRVAEREEQRLIGVRDEANRALGAIRLDQSLDLVLPVVGGVSRHIEVQRQRLTDLAVLKREIAGRQEAVDKALTDLGLGWDEPRALAIRGDFTQVRTIRQFADDTSAAHDRSEVAARDIENVRRGISARQKDLERLRETLSGTEPVKADELGRQSDAIRRVRTNLAELADILSRMRADEQSKKDRLRALVQQQSSSAGSLPSWLVPGVVSLSLIAALGAGWRVLNADLTSAVVLMVVVFGVLAMAVVLSRRAAKAAAAAAEAEQVLRESVSEIEQNLAPLAGRASEIRVQIAADAELLGLPMLPSPIEVEERDGRRERERDERRKRDEAASGAASLERELDSWRESEEDRQEKYGECLTHEKQLAAEWTKWKQVEGIPPELGPDAALDFLQQVREVREVISTRDAACGSMLSIAAESEAWQERAGQLLCLRSNAQALPADGNDLLDLVRALERLCMEEAQHRRDHARIANDVLAKNDEIAAGSSARDQARRDAIRTLVAGFDRLRAVWTRSEPSRAARRQQIQQVIARVSDLEASWLEWQKVNGIDGSLSPDSVLDFFSLVRRARDAISRRAGARTNLEKLESAAQQWQEWAARVVAAVSDVGRATPEVERQATWLHVPLRDGADAWLDAVRDLAQRCRADFDARREAARLDREIDEAARGVSDSRRRLETTERDMATFLAGAGASSEEEFRQKLSVFKARRQLGQRAHEFEGRIVAGLGRGDDAAMLRAELVTGRLGEWEAERGRNKEEVTRLQGQHEEAIRAHQDLANSRRALEEASDVASLDLEYQGVVGELTASVNRWRLLRLARGMVAETLGEFERTRQPQVLAAASGYFCRVTDGRYSHIVQTEDGNDVAIIDRLGARRAVTDLSRGTREQLYLCVRLGLAHEFGERVEPLPLVMDDVLVNFDPTRARQMAIEMLEFASRNQILLFTCHPFTRDLIADIDPDVRVIELPLLDLQAAEPVRRGGTDDVLETGGGLEGDELRARVLEELRTGEMGITDITERLGCSGDRLRPILSALRGSGHIVASGHGRGTRYALSSETVGGVVRTGAGTVG